MMFVKNKSMDFGEDVAVSCSRLTGTVRPTNLKYVRNRWGEASLARRSFRAKEAG